MDSIVYKIMLLSDSDFAEAMMRPETYGGGNRVEKIETHISRVFLVGDYVYKVKKPVNFGFLDFTTPEKRKLFCEREVEINRRLSPEIYLGVVTVNLSPSGLRISGEGDVIDYAVKMRRIAQEKLMSRMLSDGGISKETIMEIAKIMASFHDYPVPEEKRELGSLKTVRLNWEENFEQTEEFSGSLIPERDFNEIRERISSFMDREELFERRMERVRRCHGDLHSGNIFVIEGKPLVFDAIEFNDRFVYSDAASDVAFLAMDLEHRGRKDLSEVFVREYTELTGDSGIGDVLGFYMCYRAYVRFKVTAFMLDQNPSPEERKVIEKKALGYFRLALTCSRSMS